jgi:hypothetical protein
MGRGSLSTLLAESYASSLVLYRMTFGGESEWQCVSESHGMRTGEGRFPKENENET